MEICGDTNMEKQVKDIEIDMYDKECRGCMMFEKENKECEIRVIPYMPKVGHCPCKTCLVKGMCQNECTDFIQYKHDIGFQI